MESNITDFPKQEPSKDAWFANWFDDVFYTKLYGHRDQEEAERAVELFVSTCAPNLPASVLDVGCGSGRHSLALRRHGFEVTGLDLSASLLSLAKQNASDYPDIEWLRQDMRRSFPNQYDAVASFFTSFGYFQDQSDDEVVIDNMRAALKPHGVLFFDFLNAHNVRKSIVPRDVKEIEGIRFTQERSIVNDCVVKNITIESDHGVQQRTESVRLYTKKDLQELFTSHGLTIQQYMGSYNGDEFDEQNSDRLIMTMRLS